MSELKGKIGLEIHVQLSTKTKLFCGCSTNGLEQNTKLCPTCLGLPGAKPVLNKEVLKYATKLALALNSKVNEKMMFSRKTYFYPDLPKNYQITQYESPLSFGGFVSVKDKKIRIRRVHIEEDPGRLKHPEGIMKSNYVLVDYNRSGIPLCEIVTEPDIETPKEARHFINSLLDIISYINIHDSKKFSIRVDVNVSIEGGEPVEIKEISSVKDIEKAITSEIIRQKSINSIGGKIKKETRRFDPQTKNVELLREKETEEEYGYIYDMDLTPFLLSKDFILGIKSEMPELPLEKLERFQKDYNVSENIAKQLVVEKEMAELFEELSKKYDSDMVSKWITGYLKKTLTFNNLRLIESKITKENMETFFDMVQKKELTDRGGEFLLREMVLNNESPLKIAEEKGFLVSSNLDLDKLVEDVVSKNKSALEEYKLGKDKALTFLVGQVMKETKGSVSASEIHQKIISKIKN